jgi:ABC-type dipeptide/oligopeptide/nickel transport system permease component
MLIYDEPSDNTIFAATDAEIGSLHRGDYLAMATSHPTRMRPAPNAGQLAMLLPILGRLATVALLVVALVFVVALLMELGRQGDITTLPEALPAAARFSGEYLENLSRGEMGTITRSGRSNGTPVLVEVARTLPKSLGLLAVALVLAVVVGLVLGVSAARRRSSWMSGVLLFASAIGTSTPSFFAAMLLIWFGVWLFKRTGQHFFPIAGFGWDLHLLLPALVLAARPAAAITRLGYNALVEILDADYVRTARGKGLGANSVLFGHVLRNAGVPLITTAIVSLSFMLAILPIVEYVFSWPGIGQALLTAIREQDTTTAIGLILPLALLFVIVNLIAEVIYRRIDPRLQHATGGAR